MYSGKVFHPNFACNLHKLLFTQANQCISVYFEKAVLLHHPRYHILLSAKGRRQPKAAKPKKMIRLEHQNIIYAACNNGSSAVITKDGGLYMFGKDTAHCHQGSGKYCLKVCL